MKRIFDRISFLSGAAAAFLLAGSCTKELPEEPVSGDALEDGHPGWVLRNFSASHEAAPKTVLDNATILWQEGDCIDILWEEGADGRTSTRAKSDSWPAATARFSTPIGAESSYYAVYPAGFASMSGTDLHITVPASQDLSADGTFGRANLAVAQGTVSEDKEEVGTLNFKNLCALLKFSVSNASVKKIVFSARGSEKVAGDCTVAFDDSGIPSLIGASSGSVTLTNVVPGDYFIPVCPVTLTSGFDIIYYDSSDATLTTCSITRGVKLTRSRFLNLGDPELSSSQKEWFVTPGGAGNRNGLNWSNAMSSNDFAKYIGQYGGGYAGVTQAERNAAAARFNGGVFYLAEGNYTATTAYAWDNNFGPARVALTCGQIEGTTNKVVMAFKGGYRVGDDVATPTGGATVFDGENESRWFTFGYKLDVTFDNVTFKDGYAGKKGGGAVAVFDGGHTAGGRTMNLTFRNCTFTNNSADYSSGADTGGAIDTRTCTSLTLDGCTFSGNRGVYGGAVSVQNTASLTVTDCTFEDNGWESEANKAYGGALHLSNITNATCSGNTSFSGNAIANGSGGAVLIKKGGTYRFGADSDNISANHVTFSGNTSPDLAGAVYVMAFGGGTTPAGITANFTKVEFDGNSARVGGAILYDQDATVSTCSACLFTDNTASKGGAISTMDEEYQGSTNDDGSAITLTLSACTFSGNQADSRGGACYLWGSENTSTQRPTVSITSCTFTSNGSSATGTEGGAVFARLNAQLALSGTTFSSNQALNGGAVYASIMPDFTIEDCTFNANGTTSGNSYGGAMRVNSANLTISGATAFTNNSVTKSGGALLVTGYHTDRHTYIIGVDEDEVGGDHVTFSGNSAAELGGAIYVRQGLAGTTTESPSVEPGITVNCSKVGFSSNSAASGGAILIAQADNTVTLSDCSFSGNHTSRCGGAIATMDEGAGYPTEAGSRSHITMNGCSFSNNYSAKGGSCYFWGNFTPTTNDGGIAIPGTLCPTVTATNTTFSGNYLTETTDANNGGAVYGSAATLSFTGCSFSQNGYHNSDYAYYGGAFYVRVNTTLDLTGVSFSQNKGFRGGAVCAGTDALIRIHNCRFTGNEATSQFGGALATTTTSHATYYLNACTFTGNKANASSHSGNVFYNKGGILCANNCSLYANGQTSNSGSDADFNFSDSDNASYPTGVIVMNTTVIKMEGYNSLVSFRIPAAFSKGPNNIKLCNNVVINKNETAGSGTAASIIKTMGYNFMEKGNSTFASAVNNDFSNDFTWEKADDPTYQAMVSLYASSDYACYRFKSGTTLSSVRATGINLSLSDLRTAVTALSVGTVSFGSDFVTWLESLTVGDGNGFNRDIAGNARSTTALWPGCYEGTAQ